MFSLAYLSSVEKSGIGFLQQRPANGKRNRLSGRFFGRRGDRQKKKSLSAGNQPRYCLPFSPININATFKKVKDEE